MLRSRTLHTIRELAAQGQSIHAIAREVLEIGGVELGSSQALK
jgi:hypothetical protein